MTTERQLLAKVLLQALEDARSGDPELAAQARRWLRTTGAHWAELLDIPPERVRRWVTGLPAPPYEQMTVWDL
ncbi:MAG TPA: hypothetical protein EYH30_04075 [Anaerolineales bacterium]|nr:hypothetical protein [Anaerolineales bacterium]